jgi:hypothetical protein
MSRGVWQFVNNYVKLESMATRDEKRFLALKTSLAELGPLRRGTVLRRFVRCANPRCRCRANPPKLHGPYYEWSRKVKGKTVTVRVTQEQAALLKQWIANSRQLDKIVADMLRVSERITEPLFQAARRPSKDS